MSTFLSGFSLSLSLILAIGAQNALVLKQGLKREHVFLVASICAVSDTLLIFAGVYGFDYLSQKITSISEIAKYGGAAFLIAYGVKSLYAAFTKNHALKAEGVGQTTALKIALVCLALTWLNPHVYLDAVVLLGSVALQFGDDKDAFAAGAVLASFVFFYGLAYGARLLAPLFAKPIAWKILDGLVAMLMFSIAASLLL